MNKGILFVTGLVLSVLVMSGMVMAGNCGVGSGTACEAPTQANVIVPGWISITTPSSIEFGSMTPNTQSSAILLNASIGEETNVLVDISTRATSDFDGGGISFSRTKMGWSVTSENPTYTAYTSNDALVCSDVIHGNACPIFHKLTIPAGQTQGSYSAGITIKATA